MNAWWGKNSDKAPIKNLQAADRITIEYQTGCLPILLDALLHVSDNYEIMPAKDHVSLLDCFLESKQVSDLTDQITWFFDKMSSLNGIYRERYAVNHAIRDPC